MPRFVKRPPDCKPPIRGLGDVIERAVKPVARLLRLGCLEKDGTLKPQSPCAKRRDRLNKAAPFGKNKV